MLSLFPRRWISVSARGHLSCQVTPLTSVAVAASSRTNYQYPLLNRRCQRVDGPTFTLDGGRLFRRPPIIPSSVGPTLQTMRSTYFVPSLWQHHATPVPIRWVDSSDAASKATSGMKKKSLLIGSTAVTVPASRRLVDTNTGTTSTLQLMNRNARRGKRANKGKRAVSRQRRRGQRRAFGNHRR